MNPIAIFAISESIKLILAHFANRGSLNNLTQAQADAYLDKLTAALPTILPTPEELENPPSPITQ